MKKSFNMAEYLRKADQRFSSYSAQEQMDMPMGSNMQDDFMINANGAAPQLKTPKPYFLTVYNSTASNLTAVLFGLNKWLLTTNFGTTAGVTVTPGDPNISYLELLQQSGQQPFETSLIRISSSNASQVTQTLSVVKKDASGQVFQDSIYTDPYVSSYQFQNTRADIPYNLLIDANTYISVTILAGATVNFTFFPAAKVNTARMVAGSTAEQQYGTPPVNLGGMQLPSRPAFVGGMSR